jgi:hypothetical protein
VAGKVKIVMGVLIVIELGRVLCREVELPVRMRCMEELARPRSGANAVAVV